MKTLKTYAITAATLATLLAAACGPPSAKPGEPAPMDAGSDVDASTGDAPTTQDTQDSGEPADVPDADTGDPEPTMATSTRNDLRWKRAAAIHKDLMRALDLDELQVCAELDIFACVQIHQIALGGNEPFNLGLYEPVAIPMATTPGAVDRMVLAACSNRAWLDSQGPALVFTSLDLDAESVDPDDENLEAQIVLLYRRLLSRDPLPQEVAAITDGLLGTERSLSALEFAKLACFAIGSTTEFIFC